MARLFTIIVPLLILYWITSSKSSEFQSRKIHRSSFPVPTQQHPNIPAYLRRRYPKISLRPYSSSSFTRVRNVTKSSKKTRNKPVVYLREGDRPSKPQFNKPSNKLRSNKSNVTITRPSFRFPTELPVILQPPKINQKPIPSYRSAQLPNGKLNLISLFPNLTIHFSNSTHDLYIPRPNREFKSIENSDFSSHFRSHDEPAEPGPSSHFKIINDLNDCNCSDPAHGLKVPPLALKQNISSLLSLIPRKNMERHRPFYIARLQNKHSSDPNAKLNFGAKTLISDEPNLQKTPFTRDTSHVNSLDDVLRPPALPNSSSFRKSLLGITATPNNQGNSNFRELHETEVPRIVSFLSTALPSTSRSPSLGNIPFLVDNAILPIKPPSVHSISTNASLTTSHEMNTENVIPKKNNGDPSDFLSSLRDPYSQSINLNKVQISKDDSSRIPLSHRNRAELTSTSRPMNYLHSIFLPMPLPYSPRDPSIFITTVSGFTNSQNITPKERGISSSHSSAPVTASFTSTPFQPSLVTQVPFIPKEHSSISNSDDVSFSRHRHIGSLTSPPTSSFSSWRPILPPERITTKANFFEADAVMFIIDNDKDSFRPSSENESPLFDSSSMFLAPDQDLPASLSLGSFQPDLVSFTSSDVDRNAGPTLEGNQEEMEIESDLTSHFKVQEQFSQDDVQSQIPLQSLFGSQNIPQSLSGPQSTIESISEFQSTFQSLPQSTLLQSLSGSQSTPQPILTSALQTVQTTSQPSLLSVSQPSQGTNDFLLTLTNTSTEPNIQSTPEPLLTSTIQSTKTTPQLILSSAVQPGLANASPSNIFLAETNDNSDTKSDFRTSLQTEDESEIIHSSEPLDTIFIDTQTETNADGFELSEPQILTDDNILDISQPALELQSQSEQQQLHFDAQFGNDIQSNTGQQTEAQVRQEFPVQTQPNGIAQQQLPDYNFTWKVLEPEEKLDFGHTERRLGARADGMYHVLLPDGRKQTVRYAADANGYRANVTYSDE